MAQIKQNSTWQKVRKLLNDLHLWMGIASGIILFVVCLSGTVYTFSTEIQEMLEPSKYKVDRKQGATPLTAEAIVAAVLDSAKGSTLVAVTIPGDKQRTWQVTVRKSVGKEGGDNKRQQGRIAKAGITDPVLLNDRVLTQEKRIRKGNKDSGALNQLTDTIGDGNGDHAGATNKIATGPAVKEGSGGGRSTTFLVDPYTAVIKGTTQDGKGAAFFMVVFKLHRWLMLDTAIGRPIVGIATIIFTLLVLTGLVIWVPRQARNWKQGLKMKLNGNWKRTNHDLHNSLGFYAAIPLLIMSLTGLTWSFEWYKNGLHSVLGTYKSKGAMRELPVQSVIQTNGQGKQLLVADYLATASRVLPYNGDYRITLPTGDSAAVMVSKIKTGFFAPAAGDRVHIDQYDAALLKKEIFSEKPLGERIGASIKALHVGNVYGTFSKIVYFLACLIATSLPVTGTLIWINSLNKSKKAGKTGYTKSAASPVEKASNA